MLQRFLGTVLHVGNTLQGHRMLEILTAPAGRLVLLAPQARASKKRFSGILDLFVTLQGELRSKPCRAPANTELLTLQSATAQNLRLDLRRELRVIVRASIFCQCVRALSPPQQAVPQLYTLLNAALDTLNEPHAAALQQSVSYYPRLLAAAGLLPPATAQCQRCHTTQALGLSPRDGNWICTRCAPGTLRLSSPAQALLQQHPTPCISPSIALELESCVTRLIGWHCGQPLRLPNYQGFEPPA